MNYLSQKIYRLPNIPNAQDLAVIFYWIIILLIPLGACEKDDQQAHETRWELVWSDEFDGPAGQLPSAANWKFDIGTDWGNAQLEYDTDRPENVSLDGNGNLAITAIRESFAGSAFTSGRITTQGLFEQAYGRFEARIQLPWGPGIWPAFWLLGSNITTEGWPQCGEIDIMEYRGQQPNIIHGSVHGPGYSGGQAATKSFGFIDRRFDTDFHVFAVEWTRENIDFYVDENLYQRISAEDLAGEWVFDRPFFIILNLAVGGNYVGFPTEQTIFPQKMIIDWVRVYREAE